jgi:hypothetical protein
MKIMITKQERKILKKINDGDKNRYIIYSVLSIILIVILFLLNNTIKENDMKTIEITNEQAFDAHDALKSLAQNSDIPDFKGRYAIARSFEKLKSSIEILIEEDKKLLLEYFVKIENGKATDLKEGMTQEDFDQARKEFMNEKIEVEIYQINMSALVDAAIFTPNQEKITLPAIYFLVLKEWLIDDIEPDSTVEIKNGKIKKIK